MGSRNHAISSGKTLLIILLALSLIALLLPRKWTGGLMSLVQIVVPFQDAATAAAEGVADTFEREAAPVPAATHHSLQREKAALEHQVAALTLRVTELENDVDILTATRTWGEEGQQIGAWGRLIPARVVSSDILPWRSSRLVNAGSLQGISRGDVVTSQFFTIDQGEARGVRNGMAILLGEAFVGIVEHCSTHTSRVKLLSDVSVQMKVRIGHLAEDEFVPLEQYFWLTGRGRGVMEIRDVDRRDIQNETIRVDDIVLSDPVSGSLPAPMVIGRIAAIDPDRNNPLLGILTVESAVDHESLRRVYVFASGAPAEGTAVRP